MTIPQIYEKYGIPLNLQEHMMRAASLGSIILDSWNKEPIKKEHIIQACLLHDIAKPMSFNLEDNTHFKRTAEEHKRLQNLRKWLIDTYGPDEHKTTVSIARELGCGSATLRILEELEWHNLERLLKENDIDAIIPIYCDMRIGPFGILSLAERLENLILRAKVTNPQKIAEFGQKAERLIQQSVSRDLDGIRHEEIEESLKRWNNFTILEPINKMKKMLK